MLNDQRVPGGHHYELFPESHGFDQFFCELGKLCCKHDLLSGNWLNSELENHHF